VIGHDARKAIYEANKNRIEKDQLLTQHYVSNYNILFFKRF
jgi:hypothetical protein